jgi:hypothetical protein
VALDQAKEAVAAEPHQGRLRHAPRRREADESPEAEIPQPVESEEEELRRSLAYGDDRAAHRCEAVFYDDVDCRLLLTELRRERAGREVVSLADARGQDQNPRRHLSIVRPQQWGGDAEVRLTAEVTAGLAQAGGDQELATDDPCLLRLSRWTR